MVLAVDWIAPDREVIAYKSWYKSVWALFEAQESDVREGLPAIYGFKRYRMMRRLHVSGNTILVRLI